MASALPATRDLGVLCELYAGLGTAVFAAHRLILAKGAGLAAIWAVYVGVQLSRAIVFPIRAGMIARPAWTRLRRRDTRYGSRREGYDRGDRKCTNMWFTNRIGPIPRKRAGTSLGAAQSGRGLQIGCEGLMATLFIYEMASKELLNF